jgi:HEAT repeat protein
VIAPLLADPQIDVAREALRALLCLDPTSPVALPALLRALQGERPGLEVVAVDGLVAAARRSPLSAPPAALEALAALLRSAVETPLREAACDAIGLLGGAAEAEILAGLLHEPSWGLRSAIVDALFALHERGVPVTGLLLPRLDEGPLSARIEIMQALGALGRHDPLVRQRILAVTLQETRHTQREAVSHALREAACHALSLCGGTEEALALLPHLALATPVMLRRRALLAVRSVCLSLVEGPVPPVVPPALLDALGRTLTDPDDRCRRLACECHGVLSASPDDGLRAATHRALPGLMRRLCERHERVARAARVALSRLKPQAPLDPALLTTPPGFGAVFASLLREDGWSPALHDELARRLRSRIQWFGVILSLSPPPELPSTLPGLAELLVERARLFGERRRNCGGADGAQLREQAWVIAQAYSLLSR